LRTDAYGGTIENRERFVLEVAMFYTHGPKGYTDYPKLKRWRKDDEKVSFLR
jgi:hypothetical protein